MKSPGLAPHFLAATLFLVPARAADQPASPTPEAFRARMLEMFDENKDGRLDEGERAKAKKQGEELGFIPEGPLRAQLMQRFDKNGNGRIDDDERPALQAFMRQRGGSVAMAPSAEPTPAPAQPEKADPVKLALERTIRASMATDPIQRKRFDRDGDGKISHEEWAMARREIQDVLGDGLVLSAMASEEEERKMKAVLEDIAQLRQAPTGTGTKPSGVDETRRSKRVAGEAETAAKK